MSNPFPARQGDRFDLEIYAQQTVQLLNLPVPPEQMAAVVDNFAAIHAIAQPVMEFALPDNLEIAPRFEP